MKDTINHVKGLGFYCPRDIRKPLKDLKQRKYINLVQFYKNDSDGNVDWGRTGLWVETWKELKKNDILYQGIGDGDGEK